VDRKLPVKTKQIDLDGDYEGWWFKIYTNPPSGVLIESVEALEKIDKDTKLSIVLPPIYSFLQLVILEWNFVDGKGKDLSISVDSFKKLPIELIMNLTVKAQGALITLPLVSKPN